MPKMIRCEKTIIDKIAIISDDLPTKEPSDYPLRDAIQQLLPRIQNLQTKGYSIGEISKIYTDNGLTISTTTLRQYIQDFSKQIGAKKAKKALKPASIDNDQSHDQPPLSAQKVDPANLKSQPTESQPAKKSTFNTSDLNNL
jgi:ATP-dependent 26S proteasome regulatory subunit